MAKPYEQLTFVESGKAHIDMGLVAGYSGIYPSGEGLFFDYTAQNNYSGIFIHGGVSIFDYVGPSSNFSNGPQSRYFSITDFKIFNPYIHYIQKNTPETPPTIINYDGIDYTVSDYSVKINLTGLMNNGHKLFNVYDLNERKGISQNDSNKTSP